MIITCEACNIRFTLDENLLEPSGSMVRCAKCRHVFMAYPPGPLQGTPPLDVSQAPGDAPINAPVHAIDDQQDMVSAAEALEMDSDPAFRDLDLGVAKSKTGDLDPIDLSRMISETAPPNEQAQDLLFASEGGDAPDSLDLELGEAVAQNDLNARLEDFNLDFDLDESDQKELAADLDKLDRSGIGEGAVEIETDLDANALDDIDDLMLDLDLEDNTAVQAAKTEEKQDFELELDLDQDGEQGLLLEGDLEEPPVVKAEIPTGQSEDLTLDLDSEMTGDTPKAEKGEDLDLSDLDTLFADPAVSTKAAESDELELTMDLDQEPGDAEPAKAAAAVSDDLDLTDLFLDEGRPGEKAGTEEDLLLDLELDVEGPAERRPIQAPAPPAGDDLDLSDLETLLDDAKASAPRSTDTQELELDLELGGLEEAGKSAEQTLVFDETPLPQVEPAKVASAAPAFEEQTLVMDAAEINAALQKAKPAAYTAKMERTQTNAEAMLAAEKTPAPDERKAAPKKRLSPPVLVAALVVIVMAGVFSAAVALNRMGIQIPFVGTLFAPEIQDPGNLKISVSSINSRFVVDNPSGQLYVIDGKVRNDYERARSYIRVTGKLFAQGKKLVQTQTFPCGNVLSDQELASLGIDDIKARLSNPSGDNKANVNLAAGASLPFMVVFYDLPDDLEEFTLEVASSVAAGK